ncbi:MAG: SDR family oxidoreductase [Deltaproteobacteria bacterium]|nr:MAG: SDR family oxidoreductase [Deltaproteobacteria bacterium]
MRKLRSYQGIRALVTGASSGIGRRLALRLAREGARLALVARRAAELQRLAEEIRAGGGDALALPCDVAEAQQVAATAARALEQLGGIDLLVNNAGYGHHRRFLEWDLEDMERVMRVNYLGTLYFTKALLPQMVERGRGWLVFVASVAGRIATPEETAYAASKFAVVGLAEALSIEVEDAGVHVLSVCPGVIRTPFFDDEALARMPPVARRQMVDPEGLVDAMLRALARGKRTLTYPRALAVAYAVRALAPGFMRRQVKRNTIGALARERRRTR